MAEIRITRVGQGETKIRNVPIAVTPEGFWCCPSPVVFQKNLKGQNSINRPNTSNPSPKSGFQKKSTHLEERKTPINPSRLGSVLDVPSNVCSDIPERVQSRPSLENLPRKIAIEFGDPGTSDLKVYLHGKQGIIVRLNVHRNVLVKNSSFFADKLTEQQAGLSVQIDDCEDVEMYVDTVGLMYSKEIKQQLVKNSVSRVLRIVKVADALGFHLCLQSCLDYLEAAPWGGEEEEKVVSSVLQLQSKGFGVSSVLKRVSSDISISPVDTLPQIMELVLKSNEERGRREMKSMVLKLLREKNSVPKCGSTNEFCNEAIYASGKNCIKSLLSLFKIAAEVDFSSHPVSSRDQVLKQIALEADNLTWLLEILANRKAADEFALMWASQQELASLHTKLPVVSRHHVSFVTARLFVGIGRGELLPSKDTRKLLLQIWLLPLINDFSWLHHSCRSFDRKVVEEGIGSTILTLPLEDQQSIFLSWLSSFLKAGDNCPNLQRAFEVWWRRAFVRPYVDSQLEHLFRSDGSMTSRLEAAQNNNFSDKSNDGFVQI